MIMQVFEYTPSHSKIVNFTIICYEKTLIIL